MPTLKNMPSQQELFLLVWEKPSRDIARDLEISLVALGRLCKQLQVPIPPKEYWAKINASKHPRKSILKEIIENGGEKERGTARSRRAISEVSLTDLQSQFFYRATSELALAGIDISELEFCKNGIRLIEPDLCAQIVVYTQRNHDTWIKERAGNGKANSSTYRSIKSLVKKMLPLSKNSVLILEKSEGKRTGESNVPKIIIQCSPTFQQQVTNMCQLVRAKGLTLAAWELAPLEYAWTVQYHSHYEDYTRAKSRLYVSSTHIWIQCTLIRDWGDEVFDTRKVEVSAVAPVDALEVRDIQLPTKVEADKLRISRDRIASFERASQALDIITTAVYRSEKAAPDDYLVLIERLWARDTQNRPLRRYRMMLEEIENDLERLEQELMLEGEEICRSALGIGLGDTVIGNKGGNLVRIKVDGMSTHVDDSRLFFHLYGRRYRKDGVLGKRQEYLCIESALKKGIS